MKPKKQRPAKASARPRQARPALQPAARRAAKAVSKKVTSKPASPAARVKPARSRGQKNAKAASSRKPKTKLKTATPKKRARPAPPAAVPKPKLGVIIPKRKSRSMPASPSAKPAPPKAKRAPAKPAKVAKPQRSPAPPAEPSPARLAAAIRAELRPPFPDERARQSPIRFARGTLAGLRIPSILLEDDEPPLSQARQDDPAPASDPSILPGDYGTGQLWLVPRDPHCFYAHWDLPIDQQRRYNLSSASRRLSLRIFYEDSPTIPALELTVHPESRYWFAYLERAGQKCVAELGFYPAQGLWKTVARSAPAQAPGGPPPGQPELKLSVFKLEPLAQPTSSAAAEEAAPAPEIPAPEPPRPTAPPRSAMPGPSDALPVTPLQPPGGASTSAVRRVPLAEPAEVSPASLAPEISHAPPTALEEQLPEWTPQKEEALAALISDALGLEQPLGSARVREFARPMARPAAPPPAISQPAISSPAPPPPGKAVTSPGQPPAPGAPGFWFNLNAELVIYGATEPTATVAIGDRPIRLRPDGTFSYRFSLPDGQYGLPISATSTLGDKRWAELRFSRGSQYGGEVAVHPTDAALRPPAAENLPPAELADPAPG